MRLCEGPGRLELWPPSCDQEGRAVRIETRDANPEPGTVELPTVVLLAGVNRRPYGLSLWWLGTGCSLKKPPFPFVSSSVSQLVAGH